MKRPLTPDERKLLNLTLAEGRFFSGPEESEIYDRIRENLRGDQLTIRERIKSFVTREAREARDSITINLVISEMESEILELQDLLRCQKGKGWLEEFFDQWINRIYDDLEDTSEMRALGKALEKHHKEFQGKLKEAEDRVKKELREYWEANFDPRHIPEHRALLSWLSYLQWSKPDNRTLLKEFLSDRKVNISGTPYLEGFEGSWKNTLTGLSVYEEEVEDFMSFVQEKYFRGRSYWDRVTFNF